MYCCIILRGVRVGRTVAVRGCPGSLFFDGIWAGSMWLFRVSYFEHTASPIRTRKKKKKKKVKLLETVGVSKYQGSSMTQQRRTPKTKTTPIKGTT